MSKRGSASFSIMDYDGRQAIMKEQGLGQRHDVHDDLPQRKGHDAKIEKLSDDIEVVEKGLVTKSNPGPGTSYSDAGAPFQSARNKIRAERAESNARGLAVESAKRGTRPTIERAIASGMQAEAHGVKRGLQKAGKVGIPIAAAGMAGSYLLGRKNKGLEVKGTPEEYAQASSEGHSDLHPGSPSPEPISQPISSPGGGSGWHGGGGWQGEAPGGNRSANRPGIPKPSQEALEEKPGPVPFLALGATTGGLSGIGNVARGAGYDRASQAGKDAVSSVYNMLAQHEAKGFKEVSDKIEIKDGSTDEYMKAIRGDADREAASAQPPAPVAPIPAPAPAPAPPTPAANSASIARPMGVRPADADEFLRSRAKGAKNIVTKEGEFYDSRPQGMKTAGETISDLIKGGKQKVKTAVGNAVIDTAKDRAKAETKRVATEAVKRSGKAGKIGAGLLAAGAVGYGLGKKKTVEKGAADELLSRAGRFVKSGVEGLGSFVGENTSRAGGKLRARAGSDTEAKIADKIHSAGTAMQRNPLTTGIGATVAGNYALNRVINGPSQKGFTPVSDKMTVKKSLTSEAAKRVKQNLPIAKLQDKGMVGNASQTSEVGSNAMGRYPSQPNSDPSKPQVDRFMNHTDVKDKVEKGTDDPMADLRDAAKKQDTAEFGTPPPPPAPSSRVGFGQGTVVRDSDREFLPENKGVGRGKAEFKLGNEIKAKGIVSEVLEHLKPVGSLADDAVGYGVRKLTNPDGTPKKDPTSKSMKKGVVKSIKSHLIVAGTGVLAGGLAQRQAMLPKEVAEEPRTLERGRVDTRMSKPLHVKVPKIKDPQMKKIGKKD